MSFVSTRIIFSRCWRGDEKTHWPHSGCGRPWLCSPASHDNPELGVSLDQNRELPCRLNIWQNLIMLRHRPVLVYETATNIQVLLTAFCTCRSLRQLQLHSAWPSTRHRQRYYSDEPAREHISLTTAGNIETVDDYCYQVHRRWGARVKQRRQHS